MTMKQTIKKKVPRGFIDLLCSEKQDETTQDNVINYVFYHSAV